MWTLGWAIVTIVFFVLAIMPTGGDFHALFLVLAIVTAGIFGFSLSATLGRWRQERDRKGSQPMGESRAPESPLEERG